MKNYKLHLIRHGLTQGNLDGIYVGSGIDMPVCEEGLLHLNELLKNFTYPKVDLVFESPMLRARQTSELLFPNAKKMVIEKAKEVNLGEFEGRSVKELMEEQNFGAWFNPESDFVPKGGESGKDFYQRCGDALSEILTYQMKNGITEAALVTHGGVIMAMLSLKGYPKKLPAQWMSDNGCGYTVQSFTQLLMRDDVVEVVDILPFGYEKTL